MTNHHHKRTKRQARPAPTGGVRPVRVRARPLNEIQEDKLALAFYLIARDLVEDRTETDPTPDPVEADAPASPTENAS